MVVIGQRRVSLGVVMQVIDEAIQQFVGGVEIQQLVVAWVGPDEFGTKAAHVLRQIRLVDTQPIGEQRGVGVGQRASGEGLQQPGQCSEARLNGLNRRRHTAPTQAFEQLVQRVEARGDGHELAVQPIQPTVAPTHVRVFKHRDRTQAFEPYRIGNEAHVARFEGRRIAFAAQAGDDELGEGAKALVQGVAHRRTRTLRQDGSAHQCRADDAERDFKDPPHGRHERGIRVRKGRQPSHCGGVAGEHETVCAKVAIACSTGTAEADPDRQAAEEQLAVLRKQGHQHDHHHGAGDGAEQTVETLGEHLTALRLHDNEHRDHGRARLRQFQAHGDPVGQERCSQHLEDVDPGHAVAACPVIEAAAPFQGFEPVQGLAHVSSKTCSGRPAAFAGKRAPTGNWVVPAPD
nr:hypothetical protein [Tanacetum cinerariifolium]